MENANVSRRQFALLVGGSLIASRAVQAQNGGLTARQVIERIQKNVGVEWRAKTVDTFKAGNPDTAVKGIVTTVMSTLDVLQRSAKAGKNLIISHEPTFYNHQDETSEMTNDEVYRAKQDFVQKNDLVIFRFHDHWHARKPDPHCVGLAKAMGWDGQQEGDNEHRYHLGGKTLGEIAKDVQKRMKIGAMRVVGDPKTKITKAAISPGYSDLGTSLKVLPQVDLLVVGEVREWEGVEYAFDATFAGQKKGLLMLGHTISEDPGMKECAAWLATFIKEVPIEFIPAGEPYWNPSSI